MNAKKKSTSWKVIVIWIIIFYPVGIYLLYKKMALDKSAILKNSKVLSSIGYLFLFAAIFSIFGGESKTSTSFASFLFYLIGGLLILYVAKRIKLSGERYKKYINIVINQNETAINNIASKMGLSYEMTVKDLNEMIDKNYFKDSFIDYGKREIVLSANKAGTESVFTQDTNRQTALQKKIVKCASCGANNVVNDGEIVKCDYCGSPLQ